MYFNISSIYSLRHTETIWPCSMWLNEPMNDPSDFGIFFDKVSYQIENSDTMSTRYKIPQGQWWDNADMADMADSIRQLKCSGSCRPTWSSWAVDWSLCPSAKARDAKRCEPLPTQIQCKKKNIIKHPIESNVSEMGLFYVSCMSQNHDRWIGLDDRHLDGFQRLSICRMFTLRAQPVQRFWDCLLTMRTSTVVWQATPPKDTATWLWMINYPWVISGRCSPVQILLYWWKCLGSVSFFLAAWDRTRNIRNLEKRIFWRACFSEMLARCLYQPIWRPRTCCVHKDPTAMKPIADNWLNDWTFEATWFHEALHILARFENGKA